MDLVVDGVYCGACIVTIEKGLKRERGIRGARVNLASKRVTVEWDDGALGPRRDPEKARSARLSRLSLRCAGGRQPRSGGREAPAALPRRRRVRRDERDAAFRCAVGGRGERRQRRDARPLSLVLGSGCDPDRRLCRAAVLRQRAARCAPARDQHGRADHHRRRAVALDVGRSDGPACQRDLLRKRRDAADVPARRARARSAHAAQDARRRDQPRGDEGREGGQADAGAARRWRRRSRRSCRAIWCWCARASASRSTASSKTGARRSTRASSPARPRRRRRRPAPWFMPAR